MALQGEAVIKHFASHQIRQFTVDMEHRAALTVVERKVEAIIHGIAGEHFGPDIMRRHRDTRLGQVELGPQPLKNLVIQTDPAVNNSTTTERTFGDRWLACEPGADVHRPDNHIITDWE